MSFEKIKNHLRQGIQNFKSKETPVLYKVIPLLAVGYLLFPLDFVSDLIPFVGQADDLTIMATSLALFNSLVEKRRQPLSKRLANK